MFKSLHPVNVTKTIYCLLVSDDNSVDDNISWVSDLDSSFVNKSAKILQDNNVVYREHLDMSLAY